MCLRISKFFLQDLCITNFCINNNFLFIEHFQRNSLKSDQTKCRPATIRKGSWWVLPRPHTRRRCAVRQSFGTDKDLAQIQGGGNAKGDSSAEEHGDSRGYTQQGELKGAAKAAHEGHLMGAAAQKHEEKVQREVGSFWENIIHFGNPFCISFTMDILIVVLGPGRLILSTRSQSSLQ